MQKPALAAVLTALALGTGLATGCGTAEVTGPDLAVQAQTDQEATVTREMAGAQLPFHADVTWAFRQVPLPPGRCTEPLPAGLDYLWMTELWGDIVSTHLGAGRIEGSICLYGQLTNPGAPPPENGIPMGWVQGRIDLVAANGDRLKMTAWSTGFTAPPGTPGFKFIEEVRFLDGGTGRFARAEGEGVGYVDPIGLTAVYDGWIRYGQGE
jgi:hypothetical protein